jgi:hypothetical protein
LARGDTRLGWNHGGLGRLGILCLYELILLMDDLGGRAVRPDEIDGSGCYNCENGEQKHGQPTGQIFS